MEVDVDKPMRKGEEGVLNPSKMPIPTAEFYEFLRAFTTRSEVQLMIETTLNNTRQGSERVLPTETSSHNMSQLMEKHVQQIVAEEVKRQVANQIRDAIADAVQQQEEVSRIQGEHIMNVVREVEHRLNVLQREVNELSHKYRNTYNLLARLCCAIEGGTDDTSINDENNNNNINIGYSGDMSNNDKNTSREKSVEGTQHNRLLDALLQALEANQLDEVRVLMAASLSPFVAVAIQEQQREQKENDERDPIPMKHGTMAVSHNMASSAVNPIRTPLRKSPSQECSGSHISANIIAPRIQLDRINTIAMTRLLPQSSFNKNKSGMLSPRGLTARDSTQEEVLHPYASVPTPRYVRGIDNMNENYPTPHPFEGNSSRKCNNIRNNISETDDNRKKNGGIGGWYSISSSSSSNGSNNNTKNNKNANGNGNRETPSLGIEAVDAQLEILPAHLSRSLPIDSIIGVSGREGVHVLGIVHGGAAARSGILIGDIILAVESRRIPTCEHLAQALQDLFTTRGTLKGVMVYIYRHSSRMELGITIA
ncbi:PDZ domain 6 [Trypanosoma melophagium]|uniref:PDZ domain 6 n=1 Tax=Trypanosoma melophagium TaxID=715481 RepID=UPI00351A2160|nr:PDZ domain 6 [Trypanosoma melophagium]